MSISSSYSNDKSSAFSKVLFAIKKYSGLFINKYGMTALEAPPAPNNKTFLFKVLIPEVSSII